MTIAGEYPNFIANGVVVHNSRNGASSRARSVESRADNILANGFVPDPDILKSNKRGMQGGESLNSADAAEAVAIWREALEYNCAAAKRMARLTHKQWAGRLLDPFDWQPTIISSTSFANFLKLRLSELAQPEMQLTAFSMQQAIAGSEPKVLNSGDWHLPLIDDEDLKSGYDVRKLSVARCARVSYNNFSKQDYAKDVDLHDRLANDGHWSPFEHVAIAAKRCADFEDQRFFYIANGPDRSLYINDVDWVSNFSPPFVQYRKFFLGESGE